MRSSAATDLLEVGPDENLGTALDYLKRSSVSRLMIGLYKIDVTSKHDR